MLKTQNEWQQKRKNVEELRTLDNLQNTKQLIMSEVKIGTPANMLGPLHRGEPDCVRDCEETSKSEDGESNGSDPEWDILLGF